MCYVDSEHNIQTEIQNVGDWETMDTMDNTDK